MKLIKNLVKNKKIFFYLLFFLLFIIVFVLRFFPIRVSYGWDESVYLQHSEFFFSGKNNYNEFNYRPIFLSLIFYFGYFIYHNVLTARFIVALLGSIGFLMVFLIGKELYNEEIGFLSSIFYGFSTFIVSISKLILTEIPSMTFFMISFYLLVIGVKRKEKLNKYLFLSGLFYGISLLTRFTSLFLFFILILYFLIGFYEKKFRKIKFEVNLKFLSYILGFFIDFLKKFFYFFVGFFLILIPYFVWIQVRFGFFLYPFFNAYNYVSDFNENNLFYVINFFNIYNVIINIGFLIYISILVYYYLDIFLLKKRFKREIAFNLNNLEFSKGLNEDFVFLFWIISYIFYISIIPHKELRYLLPIFLPFFFLSSKGFYILNKFLEKKINIMKIKIASDLFIIGLIVLFMFFSKESFDKSNNFIDSFKSKEVKVSEFLMDHVKEYPEKKDYKVYVREYFPVYGYYTNFTVMPIIVHDNDYFYKYYIRYMNKNGFFINYKDSLKSIDKNWLKSNTKFKLLKEIEDIEIYEYTFN
ncbi:MAG: glycosyltransferase family 39 protein [Candidatus Woesearchaeota archaeon]